MVQILKSKGYYLFDDHLNNACINNETVLCGRRCFKCYPAGLETNGVAD